MKRNIFLHVWSNSRYICRNFAKLKRIANRGSKFLAFQKCATLVDIEKCCKRKTYLLVLAKSASIQPRISPRERARWKAGHSRTAFLNYCPTEVDFKQLSWLSRLTHVESYKILATYDLSTGWPSNNIYVKKRNPRKSARNTPKPANGSRARIPTSST